MNSNFKKNHIIQLAPSMRKSNRPIGPGVRRLEVRITRQRLVWLTIGQVGPPDKSVGCLYVS